MFIMRKATETTDDLGAAAFIYDHADHNPEQIVDGASRQLRQWIIDMLKLYDVKKYSDDDCKALARIVAEAMHAQFRLTLPGWAADPRTRGGNRKQR